MITYAHIDLIGIKKLMQSKPTEGSAGKFPKSRRLKNPHISGGVSSPTSSCSA